MRAPRYLLLTGIIATVALAGCSSGSSDSASTSSAGSADKAAAPAERAPQDAAGQAQDQPAKAPDLSVDQRSIIYTGSITVQVKDINVAATQASSFATGSGGFVGGDERHSAQSAAGNDNA